MQLQMLLIEVASCNDRADFPLIVRAYHFAHQYHQGQVRSSGRPFLQHCVEVARILGQMRLDAATVAAGLLHDVLEDTNATYAEVNHKFGDKIANLINGVTKIDRFTYASQEARQAETYRKMLLSMVADIRVILIKFADRLHNMRTLDHVNSEQQCRIARETLDVYAPLAHRFGLARMRWELEDLSLKYLEPEAYAEIRRKVSMKRQDREAYIDEFKTPIQNLLQQHEVEAEIVGRPKNFYGIFHKMQTRNKPFEEIYDLLAVRILVPSTRECYNTLGLVHSIYQPVPERIKDYIYTPKSNMYQSLHTVVIGPRGKSVEVQIRSPEMHHTAEIGIAAHWRYKSSDSESSEVDRHVPWLRRVVDWQRDATDPTEFMETLKVELFRDEVFIFTPQGDLLQLARGATPIDFAFAVHTDIGLHCQTAHANGHIVSLSAELKSGDTIEIGTSPHQKPSSGWLDVVKTAKARQSIRRWLREERFTHNISLGREWCQGEFKRADIDPENLTTVAKGLGFADSDHLFAAVGNGEIPLEQVAHRLARQSPDYRHQKRATDRHTIRIQGMENEMFDFALCCSPIPGDSAVGLITRGRGVSVHRTDCANMGSAANNPNRLLHVEWAVEGEHTFAVHLRIRSHNRNYLLTDITKVLSDCGVDIRGSTTHTRVATAEQQFSVGVKDNQQLQQAISCINQVDGVFEVQRIPTAPTRPAPGDTTAAT